MNGKIVKFTAVNGTLLYVRACAVVAVGSQNGNTFLIGSGMWQEIKEGNVYAMQQLGWEVPVA